MDLKTNGQNLVDSFRVIKGVKQSLEIIKQFKPDVIFIKGGYVGLPVGLAARLKRIPYIIHESDAIPGLTNRLLAKGAKKIAVGFGIKNYQNYFPPSKTIFTGNPIRADLLKYSKSEGIARFRLDSNLPTILITGGSQGARLINETILDSLFEINNKYQVIHLVGKNNIDEIQSTVKKMQLTYPQRYKSFAFLTRDIGLAFAAADLIISRAGANTIAELAALSKPTILIPNALLASGHQIKNALVLSRQGAARVIAEDKLNAQVFLAEIDKILSSPEEQEQLARSISKIAAINASKDIVKLILAVVATTEEGK